MQHPTDPKEINKLFDATTHIQAIEDAVARNQEINSVFGAPLENDQNRLEKLYALFSEKTDKPKYQQLLIYATFRVLLEQNGVAEEQTTKLYTLFCGDIDKIKKYLCNYAKQNPKLPDPMHAACNFAIPPVDSQYNPQVWSALSEKYLLESPFRQLLPQAAEVEALIKTQERAIPKADKPSQKKAISELTDEIKTLNSSIKDRRSHASTLTPEQKIILQKDVTKLSQKKSELTTLGIPFNNELTLTALGAFREKYVSEASASYKQFLENGLTKKDHEKFTNLERHDDDTIIPPLMIDGATIGHPGYYLMKVPVMDEAHAARAAYFGKLTNCCQSLSGEVGEPCVIHGLTSPNGGFYVVCHGNYLDPQVADEVLGQSWVWRGKENALVFDSIETTPKNTGLYENKNQIVTDLVRHAAKQLTDQYNVDRVLCGANSGISSEVGVTEILIPEQFRDYQGYSDAKKQLILKDKFRPFYFFGLDEQNTQAAIQWVDTILKDKNPLKSKYLWEAINWALLSNNTNFIQTIQTLASQVDSLRLPTVKHIIHSLQEYITKGLTPNIMSYISKNVFFVEARDGKGSTPLMLAVSSRELETSLTLIQQSTNLEQEDDDTKTVLMRAAESGQTEIVIALIKANANLEHEDFDKKTALMLAAENGYATMIELLRAKANVDHVDRNNDTALTVAAENGHAGSIIELLRAKANVDHVNSNSNTSLMAAAANGHTASVIELLRVTPNLECIDTLGNTALLLAAENGHTDCVIELIRAKANLEHVDTNFGRTALMIAAEQGNIDILVALLQAKVNLEYSNKGRTALIMAARAQHSKAITALLEAGANPDHVTQEGNTALMLAAGNGDTKSINALIQAKANLEHMGPSGETALMRAAHFGHLESVLALLQAGANPNQVDINGKTALTYAIEEGKSCADGNQKVISAIENRLKEIEAEKAAPAPVLTPRKPEYTGETKTQQAETEEPPAPVVIRHRRPSE